MLTLRVNNKKRPKSNIDLHDKRVVTGVSIAMARIQNAGLEPKAYRNDARTVVSAWVLGQDVDTAAQRLLTWACIDCGMKVLYLDNAHPETVARVRASAKAGYATLHAVEIYGSSWIDSKPENKSGGAGVP